MNKIALALILLILPFSLVYTSPRKKVGIVLSGGGAKGVAHIGVIKALEELNIPIDYIAGTSIGAIIGGLYSRLYIRTIRNNSETNRLDRPTYR